jgi:hypothetical protein
MEVSRVLMTNLFKVSTGKSRTHFVCSKRWRLRRFLIKIKKGVVDSQFCRTRAPPGAPCAARSRKQSSLGITIGVVLAARPPETFGKKPLSFTDIS